MIYFFTKRYLALLGGLFLMGSLASAQDFLNPISYPDLIKSDDVELQIDVMQHNFNPNGGEDELNTLVNTYAFNIKGQDKITYLGPTIAWQYGHDLHTEVTNNLPHRATVHWHGAHVPVHTDGGPHQIIPKGDTWKIDFEVKDKSATMWYHPHVMDDTYEQVQMGMSGMIYVEDPEDETDDPQLVALHKLLPHDYKVNDFPLIIQTKKFTTVDGKLAIDSANGYNKDFHYIVNGLVDPNATLPANLVRLRILNGDAKYGFSLGVEDDEGTAVPVQLIALDAGYTDKSYAKDEVLIAPGGRMEWLLDLRGYNEGDVLYLYNYSENIDDGVIGSNNSNAKNPIPYGNTALLKIIVGKANSTTSAITEFPIDLFKQEIPEQHSYTKTRTKTFYFEQLSGQTQKSYNIDHKLMDMMYVNDTVLLDSTEIWTIVNPTDVAHPWHIHDVHFHVLEIMVDNKKLDPKDYPELFAGPLDNVFVLPGWSLSYITKFEDYGTMVAPDSSYMFHCHILPHEDKGMMGQFVVWNGEVPAGVEQLQLSESQLKVFPNPARDALIIKLEDAQPSQLRLLDMQGRVLWQQGSSSMAERMKVPVGHFPRGLVLLEWQNGQEQITRKILLE